MNGQDVHVTMFKIASAMVGYSLGIGIAFGSTIAAVLAILQ